jgi:hypothetical protein
LLVRHCGAGLLLLAGAVVRADGADEIARCARIASTGDRIICLEDALRRMDEPRARTSAETEGTATDDMPVSDAAAPGEATGARPDARATAEFGFDESRRRSSFPESIRVTVVAVEKNAYGKLRYITDGGQVWQQIDQRTPRYADLPFAVEIRTAATGSFFLQPLESGIAVRVQRKQ